MPDEYLKQIIASAVRLRRLENTAALRITEILDAELSSLLSAFDAKDDERTRAKIIRQFAAAAAERIPILYEKVRTQAKRDALNIAASESEKTAAAMLKASGKKTIANPVSVNRLKAIYEGDAIEGLTVDEWWRHNERKLKERIHFETKAGLDRGESLKVIKARIETDVLPRAKRHAEALTRTSANNLANAATYEAAESSGVSRGYRWKAILDRRTSKICLAYAAKNLIYPYAPSSPRPPAHFNCRSNILPVIIGRENLDIPEDADKWLRGMSKEAQDEILGERRAELFRKGRIKLNELVRSDGSTVSIPELRGVAALFQP